MDSSPGFQSGNAGFESRWDHCGYRTKVSTSDCESEDMGSIVSSTDSVGAEQCPQDTSTLCTALNGQVTP